MNQIDARPSARKAHHDHEEQIQHLLKQIAQDVRLHGRRFHRNGARDWGFVGDLAHVEEQLAEICKFLNNEE